MVYVNCKNQILWIWFHQTLCFIENKLFHGNNYLWWKKLVIFLYIIILLNTCQHLIQTRQSYEIVTLCHQTAFKSPQNLPTKITLVNRPSWNKTPKNKNLSPSFTPYIPGDVTGTFEKRHDRDANGKRKTTSVGHNSFRRFLDFAVCKFDSSSHRDVYKYGNESVRDENRTYFIPSQ